MLSHGYLGLGHKIIFQENFLKDTWQELNQLQSGAKTSIIPHWNTFLHI